MKRARSVRLGGFVVALALAMTPFGTHANASPAKPASNPSQVNKELAQLRRATAGFHQLSKAKAAGWIPTSPPAG
jgi:hypothetical protein